MKKNTRPNSVVVTNLGIILPNDKSARYTPHKDFVQFVQVFTCTVPKNISNFH